MSGFAPKGHEGPLCGSCLSRYGSGLSSKCKKCLIDFFNVVFILVSILLLMGLTAITVNGTLNFRKRDVEELHRQNVLPRSVERRSLPSPEEDEERANASRSTQHSDSRNDPIEEVAASEALLAKWKAVEMFKVRETNAPPLLDQVFTLLSQITLSFIQTTVLLASLDVGWALHLLVVAETAGEGELSSASSIESSLWQNTSVDSRPKATDAPSYV